MSIWAWHDLRGINFCARGGPEVSADLKPDAIPKPDPVAPGRALSVFADGIVWVDKPKPTPAETSREAMREFW